MTVIKIPDKQAEELKVKAAAQGLTLEALLKKLADGEGVDVSAVLFKEVAARIREIRLRTKPDPEGWTVHDYINYGRL